MESLSLFCRVFFTRTGSYPASPAGGLSPENALAHHLFQFRERRIGYAGAGFAGVLDDTVQPAIDIDNGPLAQPAIAAVGFVRGKAHTADITLPPADAAFDRFGHHCVMHAHGIAEVSSHERQHLRT